MSFDACIVGSGPNGLAAAIALAQSGASVVIVEARDEIGGGTRTAELTLPGFRHDVCSAVHPLGILSPFFRSLPLEQHGLRWIQPAVSVAHPLDHQPAVLLRKSLTGTAEELGVDRRAYEKLVTPFVHEPHALLADILAPLRIPHHPFRMLRFGLSGLRSATGLAKRFRGPRAAAVLAGCAAHSVLPLERALTGAVGLMFAFTTHVEDWPLAEGGSAAIASALASLFEELGGTIRTGHAVHALSDLPPAKVYLFDTDPSQLTSIAGSVLPPRYVRTLERFRYGPGVFKLDWALSEPIPWRDPNCLEASTVHIGGTLEEVAAAEAAVWQGEHPQRPFVLLCQQSQFDPSRAPAGQQTGYAYCHVPADSTVDMTDAIENQIERFAPGFRDIVLARHATSPRQLAEYNPNYIGGAIAGGVSDLPQAFLRPAARIDPYSTPHPRLFLCSASTPPGGGVHGMCGFHAAKSALRRLERLPNSIEPLSDS